MHAESCRQNSHHRCTECTQYKTVNWFICVHVIYADCRVDNSPSK